MSSHRCGEELELVLEVDQHQLDKFKNITHVRKKAEMSANLISRKPYQTINHLSCFKYNFFKTTHTHTLNRKILLNGVSCSMFSKHFRHFYMRFGLSEFMIKTCVKDQHPLSTVSLWDVCSHRVDLHHQRNQFTVSCSEPSPPNKQSSCSGPSDSFIYSLCGLHNNNRSGPKEVWT